MLMTFDSATSEFVHFQMILPQHYSLGGINISLVWMAAAATSGDVVWGAQYETHADDAFDLDSDSFAFADTVQATAPSVSGEVGYDPIVLTDGSFMDDALVGESGRLRIYRATGGSDTMSGDAQLLAVQVREV
jgi:hypothetical protein